MFSQILKIYTLADQSFNGYTFTITQDAQHKVFWANLGTVETHSFLLAVLQYLFQMISKFIHYLKL